jgi:hypothetical protein
MKLVKAETAHHHVGHFEVKTNVDNPYSWKRLKIEWSCLCDLYCDVWHDFVGNKARLLHLCSFHNSTAHQGVSKWQVSSLQVWNSFTWRCRVITVCTGWFCRYSNWLRAGRSGFDSQQGLGIFLFDTVSRPAPGPTQPPIQWIPLALSMEVKRPGCEAGHSLPSSAEVKECVELYLQFPIRLYGVVLSEAQGQL